MSLMAPMAPAALAQDAPSKRAEGRYFVELSEIMLSAKDFDLEIGSITGTGSRAGEPAQQLTAELSSLKEQPPRVLIGLNRPSGKTSVEFHVHDFHLKAAREPVNFDAIDQVVTTTLLAPGIVFQRQQPEAPTNEAADDFVPNYGNEIAYDRRADYRSGGFTVTHNIKESERYRLRWLGGLKYAELDQAILARMSFTKEPLDTVRDVQDFYAVQATTTTHGLGPNAGLEGRCILDKKRKKWSVEGRGEVAFLPESTRALYGVSMVDTSGELLIESGEDPPGSGNFFTRITNNTEAPIIPGLGSPGRPGDPFNALVRQDDFTDMTILTEGRLGIRYQASKFFTLGLDAWGMRWGSLLSDLGIVDTIHRTASYEQTPRNDSAPDPQLQESESVIHVGRFSQRQDVTFSGVSLNMKFDF
jgi:hypothetical protein